MGESVKKIYLVFAELGASSGKFQGEGYAGGFVTAVVPAANIRAAIDAGETALREDGYQVSDVDKVLLFEPDEWEHDEEVTLAAKQSADDNEIRYTTFKVWWH